MIPTGTPCLIVRGPWAGKQCHVTGTTDNLTHVRLRSGKDAYAPESYFMPLIIEIEVKPPKGETA